MTTSDDRQWQMHVDHKLDTLSEAVVTLARMEERMLTLFKQMNKYEDQLRNVEESIISLEKATHARGIFFHMLDKGVWIILGGVSAYLVKKGGL